MLLTSRSLPTTVIWLLTACATTPNQHEDDRRYQVGSGTWGERVVADAAFLPGAWFKSDRPGATSTGADDSLQGSGYSARLGVGNREQSIGILYQGFNLDNTTADLDIHSVYLDFDVRIPLAEGGGVVEFLAGAGLGFAAVDYGRGATANQSEGAAQLRLGIGFRPTPRLSIDLGGGGVLIGHLGDTETYGSYLLLGASLSF